MFPQAVIALDASRQPLQGRSFAAISTPNPSPHGGVRHAAKATCLALALAMIPAPHAAETRFSIRITPNAATAISSLRQGKPLAVVLASLPQPGSSRAFTQTCHAEGGHPDQGSVAAGITERTCL